jgi:hypothetical protein
VPFLTIDQKPTSDDFAKARELIEARGTGSLSLHDRRVVNLFYKNAGTRLCDDVDHVISIKGLRGPHKGGERVKDSIIRLQTTLVCARRKGSSARHHRHCGSATRARGARAGWATSVDPGVAAAGD